MENYRNIAKRVEEYYATKVDIYNYNLQIKEYIELKNEAIENIKISKINNMPTSNKISNPTLHTIETLIDSYDSEIKYLTKLIQKRIENKRVIQEAMNKILDSERKMLGLILENKYTLKEISMELSKDNYYCHDSNISRKKREILEKLDRILNNIEKNN